MNVLVFLVPLALALGLAGLVAFVWSLKNRQYEDMDGAAYRMLMDDDLVTRPTAAPAQLARPDRSPTGS